MHAYGLTYIILRGGGGGGVESRCMDQLVL